MSDPSDLPAPQSEVEFQEVIDALLAEDKPFPPRLLYRFTDLHDEELEQLGEVWPTLTEERRERMLEDLELLTESNFVVSFDSVFKMALSDPHPRVRQLAIRALWEAEEPELVPLFIEILEKDPDLQTRAQAANGLGRYIFLAEMEELEENLHRQVLDILLASYHESYPETIRQRALEALGFSSDERIPGLIEDAYNQDDDDWLVSALIAMGRSANSQWIPMVIENIAHSDNLIRLRAVQAAGELTAAKSVEHLIERLQDPDDEVRMAAVWSLSEIGGQDARDAIEAILEETEDEDELDLIEDALENLEFSDMVTDFTLFDLEEEDLEDMIHPEEDEDEEEDLEE